MNVESLPTSDLPAFMTPRQVCIYLQISRRAFNRLADDGRIPTVKLGEGRSAPIRVPRDEMLQAFGLGPGRNQKRRNDAAAERERHELAAM